MNTLNMYFDGKAASFMNENENENVAEMFVWTLSFVYLEELESRGMTALSLSFHHDPCRGDCCGCFQGFPRLTALVVLFSFSSPPQVFLSLGSDGYC